MTTHIPPTSHSTLVTMLCKDGADILNEITFLDAHLLHMILGISGESGELLDAIKKAVIYRQPLDLQNVVEELGDLEFYLEGLRQGLHISREQVLEHNIAKLTTRYQNKYSNEAAQNRVDKLTQ